VVANASDQANTASAANGTVVSAIELMVVSAPCTVPCSSAPARSVIHDCSAPLPMDAIAPRPIAG
jgi:hypothetical protein